MAFLRSSSGILRVSLLVVSVVTCAAGVTMLAQGPESFSPPRTPWGDPDLQGTWPGGPLMAVPFERPPAFGARAELTTDELAQRNVGVQSFLQADGPGIGPPSHWFEMGDSPPLTSLVVDPPDGRLPPLTDDGARRAKEWRASAAADHPYEQPADFRLYDRCITRGVLGSAFPNIYSSGMQILQAPGYVVIRHEMIHESRIIPLDGRSPLGPAIRSYMGDARGRWDGDTLVVETTNFNGLTGSYGRNGDGNPTSEALRLLERFRLVDADTLSYEVTVEDPLTYTRPWTAAFPLPRDDDYLLYEYACHEGNRAMRNILSERRASDN